MPKTAPKSPNSSARVLKTSSHKRRRWKWAKHCFFGFLGNVEPKWCRKYRKWLCCEIFVTKSKLKARLAVWRNLLPYIFQGGLQPGSPCRRAAPARVFCKFCRPLCMFIVVYIGLINQLTLENKTVKGCHYTAHTQSNENVQLGFGLDIADLQLLVEWHTNCDGKYLGQFYSLFNLKNIF